MVRYEQFVNGFKLSEGQWSFVETGLFEDNAKHFLNHLWSEQFFQFLVGPGLSEESEQGSGVKLMPQVLNLPYLQRDFDEGTERLNQLIEVLKRLLMSNLDLWYALNTSEPFDNQIYNTVFSV